MKEYCVEDRALSMIQELSDAYGPSGFEDEAVAAAKKYAEGLGELEEDCLRNLYIWGQNNGKPVLMLDAHGDELGFMIHSIKPNGTLRFLPLGGWNANSLTSSKVLVRNSLGQWIPGVISSKPVHFMSASEKGKGADIENMTIDVGALSSEEAVEKFHIRIGEPVVPAVKFEYDKENDVMFGKAFDCRIGCAALIEALRRLKGQDLAFDVVGTLSSQEEIGERGVKVAVNRVMPKVAICFEGCPADDTFTEPYAIQTGFKRGPMLRFMDKSIVCSPRFMRYSLDLAEKLGIPAQASVRTGGGNNGAIIHTTGKGIPTIVIGVPVRYIHAHHGITSYYDFEATVQLACAIVSNLTPEIVDTF